MTLEYDKVRKTYGARIKHRTFGVVHLALKTKEKTVAMRRHTALERLLDTGEPVRDLVDRLRKQRMTIQSVEECVRLKHPFDTLRASSWPVLGAAIEEYTDAIARRDGSPSTHRAATSALAHALSFFGASRRVETITHDEVEAFKDVLAGALANNTVNAYLTRFGALYRFLQTREARRALHQQRAPMPLFSPLDRAEIVPAWEQTRVRFLTDEEATLLLAACPIARQPAIAIGLLAGLRGGEIVMLRRGVDVDLGAGVIRVQGRTGWAPKYRKDRDVPISSALRPYLEAASERTPESPYLFAGRDPRSPLLLATLRRDFARVVTTAELVWGRSEADGITLHTLRHTFASWLVMAGADLFTISTLMGHAGIQQVERTYAHLSPAHTRATVELLSPRWRVEDTTSHPTESARHA